MTQFFPYEIIQTQKRCSADAEQRFDVFTINPSLTLRMTH